MTTNNLYTRDDLETALNNAKAGIDIEKNQDIIISSKNFYYALLFAIKVSNANIEKLQQLILDSDDYQFAYLFATNISNADIHRLSEVVLKSKSICYIYWFANEVEGANIQKFIDVLKTKVSEDHKYIVTLKEKLKKQKLTKTPEEAYEEALKGINVKENEAIIIASNDVDYCYYFARDVKEANLPALQEVVIKRNDAGYCYLFAINVEGANISALQEVVIKSNNAIYCYYFARDIKGASIPALQEVVIKSNNAHCCYIFAMYVEGANIEKLLEVVKFNPNYQKEAKELEEKLKKINHNKLIEEQAEPIKENAPQAICYKTHLFKKEGFKVKDICMDIEDFKDFTGYPINSKPIKETNWLKENAIEGIYQGISQTVVKNLAKSIIELLKLNKVDEPSIYLAEKFLSSPIGISILLALIGAGIHFIPAKLTQDNIHIQKVGDKCIQSCAAIGSEHLINLAMNFVLPAITNAVSSNKQISVMEMLEHKPKARVNVENDNDLDLYERLAAIAAKKSYKL